MNKTIFSKDLENKKILVTREFSAPLEKLWQAWTDSNILDQWWAPKPWKARSKTMDFSVGGHWLYAMVGPNNAEHWARVDFTQIDPQKSFQALDSFCDEHGNKNSELPATNWKNDFTRTANGTKVETELVFASSQDLEKMVEMGFQQGFSAAHDNLDEYIKVQGDN